MKTPQFKLLSLLATLALGGCRSDPLGPTGVQVDLLTADPRLYATNFDLLWLDDRDRLFQVRVPEEGVIDELQAPAVSVFIALSADKVGKRRVAVRGYRGDALISEGAVELMAGRNVWTEIGIKMVPFGTLPDSDVDGLPDQIDYCPHEKDPCGQPPPEETPDAGTEVDAGEDAGGPDLTAPADAGTEVPPVQPTNLADAATERRQHSSSY
jgi:hypothetical protein